ncbi:MAG: hypothetical protein GC137_06040 [Alphaproteobacteria bacterium]|nr:hypothetical protein [Alphaproteobacteria bacterium]
MTEGWRLQAISDLLVDNGCEVSSKVSERGFNINVPRGDNESRSEWAERTKEVARSLLYHSDREIQIPHETFNNGRIVALTKQGTVADAALGNVERGNVAFYEELDLIHQLPWLREHRF